MLASPVDILNRPLDPRAQRQRRQITGSGAVQRFDKPGPARRVGEAQSACQVVAADALLIERLSVEEANPPKRPRVLVAPPERGFRQVTGADALFATPPVLPEWQSVRALCQNGSPAHPQVLPKRQTCPLLFLPKCNVYFTALPSEAKRPARMHRRSNAGGILSTGLLVRAAQHDAVGDLLPCEEVPVVSPVDDRSVEHVQ